MILLQCRLSVDQSADPVMLSSFCGIRYPDRIEVASVAGDRMKVIIYLLLQFGEWAVWISGNIRNQLFRHLTARG